MDPGPRDLGRPARTLPGVLRYGIYRGAPISMIFPEDGTLNGRLVDRGYCDGDGLLECEQSDIEACVTRHGTSPNKSRGSPTAIASLTSATMTN